MRRGHNPSGPSPRSRRPPSAWSPPLRNLILLPSTLALALALGCGGTTPAAPPAPPDGGGARSPSTVAGWEAEARGRFADDGLEAGRVRVVEGTDWRAAAAGGPPMAEALARAGLPGLRVEARGRSFCARTAAGPDCLFVTVVAPPGSTPAVHEVEPDAVEAVVLVEPAPPHPDAVRMSWRAELTTGRLFLFLRGWASGPGTVRNPPADSLWE